MTSAQKIEANRVNARASTGPKTGAGKVRVSQNARRHGLNLSVLADPTLSEEVESLAAEIAGRGANSEIKGLARRIAEAQVDLVRIRRARHELISRKLNDPDYESAATILRRDRFVVAYAKEYGPTTPMPASFQDMFGLNERLNGPEKFAAILADVTKKLVAIERYERRALSRRKFTIRDFDANRRQTGTVPRQLKTISGRGMAAD